MMAVFTIAGVILGIGGIIYMGFSLCRPEEF